MYNAFYGFSEKPFEVTPDPAFLYFTPTHQQALDTMTDCIKKRLGFVSITGEVGTGKTTLVHALLSRLDEKVKTIFIFHPPNTFKELLRSVLLELGLNAVGKSEDSFLNQLGDYLLHYLDGDESVAIIIDEAQNLSEEVLKKIEKLSKLELRTSARLQVVFVGQPEFNKKFNSEGLRQLHRRIGVERRIKTLNGKESEGYIEHRLKMVGCSSLEVFTPKAISLVIRYAQGIPRIINILCDNAFLNGYALSVRRIDEGIIRKSITNLEGHSTQKAIASKIVNAGAWLLLLLRLKMSRRRVSLVLLSLFVLAGLALLTYKSLPQNRAVTGSIESIMRYPKDTEGLFSNILPPQTPTNRALKISHPASEKDPVSLGFLQPGTLPFASASLRDEKGESGEVTIVKEGQSLSSLAQKHYQMTNATLVDLILDFNPEIDNAHLIQINQRIKIPKVAKEWLISQSSDCRYRLHVGTFWIPDFIKPYRTEPALRGKTVEIMPRRVSPNETWYRVVVGTFDSKDEVLKVIDLLKGKGLLPLFGGLPKTEQNRLGLLQVMGYERNEDHASKVADADHRKNIKK